MIVVMATSDVVTERAQTKRHSPRCFIFFLLVKLFWILNRGEAVPQYREEF